MDKGERGESQREEIERGEDERNRLGEERNELGLQLGEAVAGATPYIYPLPNTPILRLTGAWGRPSMGTVQPPSRPIKQAMPVVCCECGPGTALGLPLAWHLPNWPHVGLY